MSRKTSLRSDPTTDTDALAALSDTLLMAAGVIAGVATQHRAALIRAGLPDHVADALTMHAVSLMQQQMLGGGK